jgi:alpha-tubulin suppressor-like RCC1 family protein
MESVVATCGSSAHGQLGRPPSCGKLTAVEELPEISYIACGAYHTLAVSAMGFVYGWGSNVGGQLCAPRCAIVGSPKKLDTGCLVSFFVVKCAAGADRSLLLTHNAEVIEVGNGSEVPRRISLGDHAADLACGSCFSLVCTVGGVLCFWGEAQKQSQPTTVLLPPGTRVARVCAAGDYSMVITRAGDVLTSSSMHDGDSKGISWQCVRHPSIAVPARDISCGYSNSSVSYVDGTVRLLDRSYWTAKDNELRLLQAPGVKPSHIVGVACGKEVTFFWTVTGQLFVLGMNEEGQLGLPDARADSPREVEILPSRETVQVACGAQHTAVLLRAMRSMNRSVRGGYHVPMEDMVLPSDDETAGGDARWDEEISNCSFSRSTSWRKLQIASTSIGNPDSLIPKHHDPFKHTRRVLIGMGSLIVLALAGRSWVISRSARK